MPHHIMWNFRIIAQVSICSIADICVVHFFEGIMGRCLMLSNVLKMKFLNLLQSESESRFNLDEILF